MTDTHTIGPWSVGIEGNNRVYGPDGMGEHSGLIAVVFKGRGNVNLIAAAPELLECLKDARRLLTDQDAIDLAHIDEVIAKASTCRNNSQSLTGRE